MCLVGGAGYIGCHTAKVLAKAGFLPVVYDNLSTGHGYAVKWGPFIQGDLCDRTKLSEAFERYKPKAVIHFAADALVVKSISNPGKYYRNNLGSTVSLLETMNNHGVKHLVFSSTCATYGTPKTTPITEDTPTSPINPYGRSKLMCEEIIHDFEKAHGIRAVILRYFNAAGADFETEVGENHSPETHLIPTIIQTALDQREEIVVYGTNFKTKDGSAVRDFIHVNDLAEAHIKALLCESQIINLGSGEGYSVFEIIEAVQKFCGKTLKVRLEKKRPGEPAILTADNAKAKKLLDWTPVHSDLPSLIETAWKWHLLLHENTDLVRQVLKC